MIGNPPHEDLRPHNFWSIEAAKLLQILGSSINGLSDYESQRRIVYYGPNRLKPPKRSTSIVLLLRQFSSPLILILLGAAILSFALSERTDGLIIIGIVLLSGFMGFWREKGAADAVKRLLSMVQTKTTCIRDGSRIEVPTDEVVPGDLVFLNAGDLIPADGLILESKDFFVDEAVFILKATPEQFRTGWFLQSVFTELLILPVIRTRRPFFKSLPSKALSYSTVLVFVFTVLLPYILPQQILDLIPLPLSWLLLLVGVSALYVIVSEVTKKYFYRRSA